MPLYSVNLEDEIDPREDGRLDRRKSDRQFDWQPAVTQNNSESAVFTVEYALSETLTLTSVSGYSQFDFRFNLDADFTDLQFIGTGKSSPQCLLDSSKASRSLKRCALVIFLETSRSW